MTFAVFDAASEQRARESELVQLVRSCRYREITERCRTHPHEARRCEADFFPRAYHRAAHQHKTDVFMSWAPPRTPLHMLVSDNNVPEDAVRALIKAWPEAVSLPMSCTGRTPLHCAACVVLEVGVIQALLEAGPSAMYAKDLRGRTPLSYLCSTYSATIGQALASERPHLIENTAGALGSGTRRASFLKPFGGSSEKDLFRRSSHRGSVNRHSMHDTRRRSSVRDSTRRASLNESAGSSFNGSLSLFWNNACALIRAEAKAKLEQLSDKNGNATEQASSQGEANSDDDDEEETFKLMCQLGLASSCIVHDCLAIGKSCPNNLLKLAIRVHPEQLREGDDRYDGNLPLHVVCHCGDLHCIPLLLKLYVKAAAIPNQSGSLPLHLFLSRLARESEEKDKDKDGKGLLNENGEDEVLSVLDKLVQANPDALVTKDLATGLYPFMVAATFHSKGMAKFDLSYYLLRFHPDIRAYHS